jgi:putative DNA primase/helicase
VFEGDAELIAFVQRFYGSCLTGSTTDRVALVEHGARFNGKSTLNRAFQNMLGSDLAQTAPARLMMRVRESEIPNELAALARKRFVVVAETAEDRKLNEARVKLLTGRDKVSARFLYGEWFEFEPECKFVLFTNHRPRIDGSDGAIWDRIRLVPFNVCFEGREDLELDEQLAEEDTGILAWAVEGCLVWQEDGLGSCDVVDRATAAYRDENDLLGRFLNERCQFERDYRVERKELRAAMLAYFEDADEEAPSAIKLGRVLGDRGAWLSKRIYRGVRLIEEGERWRGRH